MENPNYHLTLPPDDKWSALNPCPQPTFSLWFGRRVWSVTCTSGPCSCLQYPEGLQGVVGEYTRPTETISTHWCHFSWVLKTLCTTHFTEKQIQKHLWKPKQSYTSVQNGNKGAKIGHFLSTFLLPVMTELKSFYEIGREVGGERSWSWIQDILAK